MSNLNYKQVTNVTRRTWDKETYEQRAKERTKIAEDANSSNNRPHSSFKGGPLDHDGSNAGASAGDGDGEDSSSKPEFQPAAAGAAGPHKSKRAFLTARRGKVDVDSKIGSVEMVNPDAVATTSTIDKTSSSSAIGGGGGAISVKDGVTKSGVGWHCRVCDCFLKDSHTYLDHINGRKHQRNLGYSMRVERSTKDQVVSRLERLAKEKEDAKMKSNMISSSSTTDATKNLEDLVRAKDDEAQRRKEERQQKRKERKLKMKQQQQQGRGDDDDDDDDDDDGEQPQGTTSNDNEEEEEEVEAEGIDPAMAAMMGFAGFGGGNKNS